MPVYSTLVLKDGEATPVNHTFNPAGIDSNGVATLLESSGVIGGASKYSLLARKGSRLKGTAKLVVPVVQTQTINGVSTPVVVRVSYVDYQVSHDILSTEQERKNVQAMFRDSLDPAKALPYGVLVNFEGVWG